MLENLDKLSFQKSFCIFRRNFPSFFKEKDYGNRAKELIDDIYLQGDDEVSFKDDVKTIVSVGQFRPEKDHALQIRAMYELRELLSEDKWKKVKLVLIGKSNFSTKFHHQMVIT